MYSSILALVFFTENIIFLSAIKQPPVSQPHQQSIFVEVSKPGSDAPSPTPQHTPSGSRSVDLHGTDAFNRLIASIRASDKVKEQMQQRVSTFTDYPMITTR